MLMVIGSVVVLAGVVVGWYTSAGSAIHRRPDGKGDAPGAGKLEGETSLDWPWLMVDWSRGR